MIGIITVESISLWFGVSRSLAVDSGISEDGSSHIAGSMTRVNSQTMGLCRPLAVVRITEDGGANMAHSVGMESHSGTMRLSLSLPIPGETTGVGGGGGCEVGDYVGELGLRRSLADVTD